ncbi:MAG: glycosyltransferase family 2 protein [gamma proteobacterium symbiont of Lucinoma myriamae]|nr:glycosyltransferase family 2 protein [gamma proteobacterium symbiont of Lucinoma myriamae]MCU7817297.1 glycosyltransferase family 2 protein [gamma proteobacterium symbiont of Lucinoma myriamae]MCU7832051.1 glycosyltransferase family 2 protein [gamma proteobacterium symbiont of Lucinoma myriamae]
MITIIIFWLCAFYVFYIYIGYPLLIKLLSGNSNPNKFNDSYEPNVSILIAAFNEEKDIKATIQNKMDLDYPKDKLEIIVVSDESTDATDCIVESFSGTDVSVKLVKQVPRQGKTAGLNLIVSLAKGDILVFSDANSIYQTDALQYLVNNFTNPDVGYVTGKMVYVNSDASMVGDGCSAYMKYENMIRALETKVGSVIGVDGGIDAMRTELYRQLNADQLLDFVLPLKVVEQGYKVAYESKAILKEHVVSDAEQEYRMRVRVALRAMWALYDMKQLLNPFRFHLFSLQLISHKLLRYLVFIPLIVLIILNALLFSEHVLYKILMAFQCVFYSFAYVGFMFRAKPNGLMYFTLPYYFSLLNIASAHAFFRYLKKEKQVIWNPRLG